MMGGDGDVTASTGPHQPHIDSLCDPLTLAPSTCSKTVRRGWVTSLSVNPRGWSNEMTWRGRIGPMQT